MTRSDAILLEDILRSISQIERYTSGLNEESFAEDEMVQDAVVRRLEVIGEAVKGLSSELRQQNGDVPWREIAGARDILIHKYFRVDLGLAWEMIEEDLPTLKRRASEILAELEQ